MRHIVGGWQWQWQQQRQRLADTHIRVTLLAIVPLILLRLDSASLDELIALWRHLVVWQNSDVWQKFSSSLYKRSPWSEVGSLTEREPLTITPFHAEAFPWSGTSGLRGPE
ncbi:hypothetical protein M5K25_021310 [Dendrobium thyrsiflorum]|uniref:Uncharacterized protein n=1 Tax=Dendrobium thyrsiflorum TaxID=117978 RepID=A0ABD0UC50_DENTH